MPSCSRTCPDLRGCLSPLPKPQACSVYAYRSRVWHCSLAWVVASSPFCLAVRPLSGHGRASFVTGFSVCRSRALRTLEGIADARLECEPHISSDAGPFSYTARPESGAHHPTGGWSRGRSLAAGLAQRSPRHG